jgi:hypothetical protein
MHRWNRSFALLLGASLCAAPIAFAGDRGGSEAPNKAFNEAGDTQDEIYGHEVMTPSEIDRYQTRMRGTMTDAERRAFIESHRAEMQRRASERGTTLREGPGLDRTQTGTTTPGGQRPMADDDMGGGTGTGGTGATDTAPR